jgi:hypothetical protein
MGGLFSVVQLQLYPGWIYLVERKSHRPPGRLALRRAVSLPRSGRASKRTALERLGQEDHRSQRRGQKQKGEGGSAERPVDERHMIESHIPNSFIVRRNTKTLHRLCLKAQMGTSMAIFNTPLSKNNQDF